ncbi:DUF2489 domain-containing protein [Amphritea pacifica]|uniref:DUF2489 domain-containing protein n=1 Tax=Amphritea pacifica TaxID=2811233 RepID=A0ABS2W4R2_9GAMM|nr:DUF2489 domain-containing protein [Amphritea pacifica]MBN0986601.1 DUF2489 domain-containing protein [Amphritea pacifica]MBN1008439.1 DUF2489 domain-containing protein [Amphritea pacifica]
MSETTLYILISVNLFIVVALVYYILRLVKQQKQKRMEAENKLKKIAAEVRDNRLHIIESLQVIGQAILNDEIPLTEACIRCKVLLDNLDPQLAQSEAYIVFNEVFEQSKHIPRKEAWKKLKGPEKLEYIAHMDVLESGYSDQVISAAKCLLSQDFNRYH